MKNYVRLPKSTDRSLRAWSAVDEHILKHIKEENLNCTKVSIFHDRFGFLTCNLIDHQPSTYTYLQSQEEAITFNASNLDISESSLNLNSILDYTQVTELHLMKVPKSLDLFRLYLIKIVEHCTENGEVIAGFMTRHFTKAMLSIAEEYFLNVSQSRAWKKSRILILSKPKKDNSTKPNIINTIEFNDFQYQQFLGVFSANHIDYATQFLLENIQLRENENSFLDIGCGNGVIGKFLLDQKSWNEAEMIDDSLLAVASSKLNVPSNSDVQIDSRYNLDHFSDHQFDLVITNPPFHFEYEVDPSIALELMSDTYRILSQQGRLIIVANRHLNYKSQLSKWYNCINIISENEKFIIYEALK